MAKKKLFPNGFVNSGLFTFGKGLLVNASGIGAVATVKDMAVGAVQGVVNRVINKKADNLASKVGGEGESDGYGLAGVIIGGIVFIAIIGVALYFLVTGQITFEEFLDIYKQVK